ncbi:hypothetical protein [Iodidimonas nitroreducens]|nr:hypothetical protein [Iodidimonas nitroreducens]
MQSAEGGFDGKENDRQCLDDIVQIGGFSDIGKAGKADQPWASLVI